MPCRGGSTSISVAASAKRSGGELRLVPDGIRTRVTGLKGQRPGPLDDGDGLLVSGVGLEPTTLGLKGRCSTN